MAIIFDKRNIRLWSMLGAAGVLGEASLNLIEQNADTLFLTADLCSFSGLNRCKIMYPDNVYNLGIAEQNMIGVAAGLAKEGFKVFATSYATFLSTRALDQIRVNMGYMKCPIKLIGLVSGYAAGILGPTHTSIEDIAIMRSIPNMVVLSPADATETMKTIIAALELNCPTYIRFSGAERNPIVYNEDYDFSIGKAIKIREGIDVSLIATGMMVSIAIKVAERIHAEHGYSCEIIDMHTIKPLDEDAIKKTLDKKLIVTLEEHSIIGGLGSAVSECLARYLIKPPQLVIGINDRYQTPAKYSTLVSRAGLDPVGVYQSIMSFINDNKLFV